MTTTPTPSWTAQFLHRLTREGITVTPTTQLAKIREELAELAHAITTWAATCPTTATRPTTHPDPGPGREFAAVAEELADLVIATQVLATHLGINLPAEITHKQAVIDTRPLHKHHRP